MIESIKMLKYKKVFNGVVTKAHFYFYQADAAPDLVDTTLIWICFCY